MEHHALFMYFSLAEPIYDIEGWHDFLLLCLGHLSGLRTWPVISGESSADEKDAVLSAL